MRITWIFCLIFMCRLTSFAQETTLEFKVQINEEDLTLNKQYELNGHPITFTNCKFYISTIKLGNAIHENTSQANYHLIDVEKPTTLSIPIPVIENKAQALICHFNIGIDSAKSVSGVFGEDLDPTNGMYWAWQSGYINCKIEGTSSQCLSRKNKFQFHLGGYASPYNSLRTCSINMKNINGPYIIILDLTKFIESIDLSSNYQVMKPSQRAMKLSDLFAKCFSSNE